MIHALFKSLLFLCAGFYIHFGAGVQDIRGLRKTVSSYPLVSVYFFGCTLSLCGVVFLAGFYSKDLILENCYFIIIGAAGYIFMFSSILFTIIYSARLVGYVYIFSLSKVKFKAYTCDGSII